METKKLKIVKNPSWMDWRNKTRNSVIVLVGLPARGKTFIALKLTRYLGWKDYSVNWFNVGNYRRKIVGTTECDSSFFDHKNEENIKKR